MKINKTTISAHEVLPLILKRWSPVLFDKKSISDEAMMQIFEAARWAPSSRNEQPWRFLYAHNGSSEFQLMFNSLMTGNQEWVKDAPVLVAVMAEKYSSYNGELMSHYIYDAGAASMQMQLQATSMGIYSHSMGGFEKNKVVKSFNIPENIEVVALIAYGYPSQTVESAPNSLVDRDNSPRQRKPVSEFVYSKGF